MPYRLNALADYLSNPYTASDWKEAIGNEQQGGETFAVEGGQASIAVKVPWAKARQFVRFVLGWSYLNDFDGTVASYTLIRENPQQHPRMPWLYASSVSLSGLGPVGTPGVGTKESGVYGSASLPNAKYDTIVATVQFRDYPWAFKGNSPSYNAILEAQRNVFISATPSVEVISAEGLNNIKFANGPIAGSAAPAPFGTLMSKTTYTLNWMWVPHEYISTTAYPILTPSKILGCVGKVNNDTFLGFAPGTLLAQAPVFEPMRFPIGCIDSTLGFYGWNVRLPIQFFDPPRGVEDANYRGHLCIPYRKDLLWYGAIRENGTSRLYSTTVFENIFANANF